MTILQFLAGLLGVNGDSLRDELARIAAAAPDLAPLITDLVGRFDEGVTSESLASLAAAMPHELKEIARFHFNPRRHPGAAI